ncbi:MAG TPA: tetratricopeptide repeat protein [Bacteroidia bacterium]|nr:tetratricopeptide repeat protein [Bacteroidia bacterium]
MGWLFGKKEPKITLTDLDKEYIENVLVSHFRHTYNPIGEKFRIHLPTNEAFPEASTDPRKSLLFTVDRIAADLGIIIPPVVIVFNDQALEWETWREESSAGTSQAPVIQLRDELLKHKALLLTHILLELCNYKLLPLIDDEDLRAGHAEILAGYYGYGVVMLCTYGPGPNILHTNSPFSGAESHLYTLALLCIFHKTDHVPTQSFLSPETFAVLEHYMRTLRTSDEFVRFASNCRAAIELAPLVHMVNTETVYSNKVIDACTQIIRAEPDNPDIFNTRGYAHLLQGNFSKAIADFDQCIELDPYYAFAFNNRSYCKMMTGQLASAINDLDASEMLDPRNSFNYRNRGIYHLLTGNPEQALVQMQRAFAKSPDTEHIHFWLGKAYFALSQLEKAQEQFALSRAKPELPAPEYPL